MGKYHKTRMHTQEPARSAGRAPRHHLVSIPMPGATEEDIARVRDAHSLAEAFLDSMGAPDGAASTMLALFVVTACDWLGETCGSLDWSRFDAEAFARDVRPRTPGDPAIWAVGLDGIGWFAIWLHETRRIDRACASRIVDQCGVVAARFDAEDAATATGTATLH